MIIEKLPETFPETPEYRLSGDIVKGDAQRLIKIMKSEKTEMDGGIIHLNSSGGDFLEGILLGNAIFEAGWTTRVNKGDVCLSACAIAFLGGKFYGASGGWGPSRKLEPGALLGFLSLTPAMTDTNSTLEDGEKAAALLYAYSHKLGIKSEIITSILEKIPENMIIVNTPRLLSGFKIDLIDFSLPKTSITCQDAINIMINTLEEKSDDWEFDPVCKIISSDEFKKDMLIKLADSEQADDYLQIKNQIIQALETNKGIVDLYKMLLALGAVPDVPDGKIYKVAGLDNIHFYKSKTGYIAATNEGSDSFRLQIILSPLNNFEGNKYSQTFSLDQRDMTYKLIDPDKPLWNLPKRIKSTLPMK